MSTAHETSEGGARWSRSVKLGLLMIAITAVALLACIIIGVADGGFEVGFGYHSSSMWRRRECIGIRHRPDTRDAWVNYCYGIPAGRWRCYEQEDRETIKGLASRKREVTCSSGAPVSEWRCLELLIDRTDGMYEQLEVPCDRIANDLATPPDR